MDPENNNQNQNSSVDKVNNAIRKASKINNIRQLKNTRKRIKAAYQIARTTYTATTTLISGGPGAVVVMTIAVISLASFLLTLGGGPTSAGTQDGPGGGGTCQENNGTCKTSCDATETEDSSLNSTCDASGPKCCLPQDTGGGTGHNPDPAPSCGTIDQRLNSDFHITLQEGGPAVRQWTSSSLCSAENISCDVRQKFWQLYSVLARSKKVENRLTNGYASLRFYYDPTITSMGYTPGNYMILRNAAARMSSSYVLTATWITHETGHLLNYRAGDNFAASFPLDYLRKSDTDHDCYDSSGNGSWYLKTYSLRTTRDKSESFAEAFALYVYNSKINYIRDEGNKRVEISNFKNECPRTYNWIRDNVFPDYEFN